MVLTIEDCKEIVQAVKATDKFFIVGHICRFNPRYAAAKKEISGDGVHDTDLMLWYTKAKIKTVYANIVNVRNLANPDIGWTMYKFDTGAVGVCDKNGLRFPDTTYWPMLHNAYSGALREELSYFVNCILQCKKLTVISPEESLVAVEACLAAEESARNGKIVTLSKVQTQEIPL